MRLQALFLTLVLWSCGGADSDPAPAPETPSLPVPRTVDKGDGCTVEITKDGAGPAARIGDEVTLTYVARLKDVDTKVASTEGWDVPLRLRLGDPAVLPGLSRGIDGLPAGSQARIEIPPSLGYGTSGNAPAGIPVDAILVFDVEILGVRP